MAEKLKIGVLGAGHLGRIHLGILKEMPQWDLVGFIDPDDEKARAAEADFGLKRFENIEHLIESCDAVDIVTPTVNHYTCAVSAIKKSRHVFMEKPLANTIAEGKDLVNLVFEANIKFQVGHVERFNPAFQAALEIGLKPMFIETHRLGEFNPRGTDVPVVLDLMIHDIDITLSLVRSNVKKVHASGVAVVSDTPDIANARIEFDNGCVANLTASRISMKKMRKSRIFQKDAYVAVDFLNKSLEVIRMEDAPEETSPFAMVLDLGNGKPKKKLSFDHPEIKPVNAIKAELEAFHHSIVNDLPTVVSVEDGFRAMELAHQILQKMEIKS